MSSIYSNFTPTYLYIKQHKVTGKLYFGKTTKNPENYNGSGIHWKSHIKKHGSIIETLWYCLYTDEESIKNTALSFSKLWNIVESNEWLNLIEENGVDGGDTSTTKAFLDWLPNCSKQNKKRKWWNNGQTQVFVETPPNSTYQLGRLPFNNIGAQKGAYIQKQKIWINNGLVETMVRSDEIIKGYMKGRLSTKAFSGGNKRHSAKNTKWWTDGKQSKMSTTSPGLGWVLGRKINPPIHSLK